MNYVNPPLKANTLYKTYLSKIQLLSYDDVCEDDVDGKGGGGGGG